MNRSQSLRKIPPEEKDDIREDRRATSVSHPNLSASLGSTELRPSKLSVEDLRRKTVRLNKELEEEKVYVKQLRREKSVAIRHVREEEQRRAASQQTELKSKLYKEKANELAALKEQMHKEKEKEMILIIRQKDDALQTAQLAWMKEKEELRVRIRAEVCNDAKEESKKEFDRERTRLEQDILDLQMQKKEIEEAFKVMQDSDKRKADEIRRLFHEHEIDMEKFKRNSWQESRRQMAEIRQLLNIIEQLERKLGLDSGHINKLRMEKEGLYDELRRKTNTFDAWDTMMSNMKSDTSDGNASPSDPRYGNSNNELRSLQRKNVELSSLVKKLDEKNQQLATRNTELLSDLERCEKDARDKNRKLEKKNLELTQNTKKLESRNKALLDEINSLKRKGGAAGSKDVLGKKDKSVRARGQATSESTEVTRLKEQIKDQAKTIEELKQNLMEKERRIDLIKERKRSGKKPKLGRSATDTGQLLPDQDDDASVVSDVSDLSEMSSNDSNSDANKLKKLAKELLALERAYAILQAQLGSTVDVERDELVRQQLQSDLIESQARIHELERMMDSTLQGGTEELQQLQHDNQVLYQKLVAAEAERDQSQYELSKNSEDLKDLQDKKDLLEFELEEMSQLSFAGSDEEGASRKLKDNGNKKMPLSLEEVKTCLEELETEKSDVLSDIQLEALRQAHTSLTSMPQKISHLEATEAVLRSKVKDLEERPNNSRGSTMGYSFDESLEDGENRDVNEQETSTDITLDDIAYFEDLEIKHHQLTMQAKHGGIPLDKNGKPIKTDQQTATDITLDDMLYYEELELENEERMLENKEQQHQIPYDAQANITLASSGNLLESRPGGNIFGEALVDHETLTELTLDDLDHLENVELENQELLLEKEQWTDSVSSGIDVSTHHALLVDQETETNITIDELNYYKNLELEYNEVKSENEHYRDLLARMAADDKENNKVLTDQEVSTELTWDDLEYYENLELEYDEFKVESEQQIQLLVNQMNTNQQAQEELKSARKNVEIETVLSMADLSHMEEVQVTHQACVDRQTRSVDKIVGTEVSLARLQHLEKIESETLNKACTDDVSICTDLTLAEIHYLEEIDTVHTEYCMTSMDNDASSRTDSSQKESKAVGTELTASVLEYLEEVASTHEEIVREYEAFRRSVTKEKDDANIMTEMTGEHLDYLDEMALKSEELENMLIDVTEEAKLKQYKYEDRNESVSKDCQLMTELSVSDIASLESELSSLRQQERQNRNSSKLSRSGYECLLDIESKGMERRHDIALMTELTIDNLKSLENSDHIYMDLKQRGLLSKIDNLTKPTKERSVITDLRVTNIEHLEQIESLYNENERRKDDIKDKETETDLSQSDLTRLENLANKNQTLQEQITLQSTDAVFGSCPRERRGRGGRYGERGRFSDVGHHGDGDHHGNNGMDVGIQCELKDILSLIEEQRVKDGDPLDSRFYVSALRINREHKEGFDPVEVVLKSGRNSSTPDVSTRDHGNSRVNTANASLGMDYGWQSSTSLDSTGFDKTPMKGSNIGRWDSPRVPLAQDEVFDLSDIESGASDESLVTPLRKESAVVKFDRYVMARKESEIDLLSNLRDTDHPDGPDRPTKSMAVVLKENEQLKMRIVELELQLKQKGDLSDEELELLKRKIQQLQQAEQQIEELCDSNTALKDRINELHEDNFASGASTSRSVQDNWSEIDPSEGRSDHGTQAGPGLGVTQESQTTGDLLKLIDLSYDGTIPEHIAKELEKLKADNQELYQELIELRRLKLENSKSRTSDGGSVPRDTFEEPITSCVQSRTESQLDWMTKLGVVDDDKRVRPQPSQPVKDIDDLLFKEPEPRPKQRQHTRGKIHEPEIKSARSPRDSKADIDRGLRDLMEDRGGRQRTDTDEILDFNLAAPPDFAPPPVPSEPPPDNEPSAMETAMESVFGSSPPRDSKALRALPRQKNQPGRPFISESFIQPDEELNVENEPSFFEETEIPPALRTSKTPSQTKPGVTRHSFTPKPVPPPTLPKPAKTGPGSRRVQATPKPGLLATPLARSRDSLTDEEAVGLTPRGYVRATASAINQGEIDALSEKINFLEKQLKNKDGVIRSMKTEATELENKSLVERKDREIKILEEDVVFLKQENQKKERDLLAKIGEINRKNYEADQWKTEATNAEKQRKRIETSYLNVQAQSRNLQGSNAKLTDLQSKHSTLEKENKQLSDKVNKLEKTEKEFKQLEYNISILQSHLQGMESVEKERDELNTRLKTVENQRDDLLKKGRMVESERNDFLRNNKIMEMQRDELEQRYAMAHEELMQLKSTAGDLEHSIKEAQNSSLDAQHERNYVQTQYKKLESDKIELQQQLTAITRERNSLDSRLADLEDRNREYLKLEDGFHKLRLKVAELTRQRDEFETQIPTFKAKVALLKKACKEKDDFIDKLNDEIRELRHSIATSTLDDLSKIKYSARRDRKPPEDVVDAKTPGGKSSPKKTKSQFPRKCVALFDYNPQTASVSGRPDRQLTLKEGDQLTLLSDMTNGCYEAELNGVRGLVPVLYVEELDEGMAAMPNGTNHVTKAKTPVSNGIHESEVISNGRNSLSPRSTTSDLDVHKQCFVALFDYNPFQSCTTGRPELELPFKKGDIMTVYGDVDSNGYYSAEMEGQTGLVPSNFVEEVSSSTFLQPTSSTAPQQILSMFDNIQVPSPQRSVPGLNLPLPIPTPVPTHTPTVGVFPSSHVGPPVFATNPLSSSMVPSSHVGQPVFATNPLSSSMVPLSHVGPPSSHVGQPVLPTIPVTPVVIPSNHGVQPVATTTPRRNQAVQPIFNPYMTPAEVHKLAAPISSSRSPRTHGVASQRSPRQQNVTSKRSPSQPTTSPPRITSQVQKNSGQPVNKPKPRQSQALVSRPQSVGARGAPDPPSNLHVLRPVNHDAILLGWDLPEMDEFGRSNGTVVKGYKIYENGEHKMDVRRQFMAKALVDDLDLRYPVQFTIRTMGEGGALSSDISTTFTDTVNNSRMSISKAIEDTVGSADQYRTFVALYDYDPLHNSPNANPQYELHFNEGDILRVEDMSRKDGFYFGSLNGKKGLIPSNFIEEVAVAKARGPSSPTRKHNVTSSRSSSSMAITNGSPSPSPRSHKKKMVAMYEYSPKEQSPLKNSDSELSFKKGQTITVVGPMNKDGYYSAVIGGRKGLVPASFLESMSETSERSPSNRVPRSS